MMVYQSRICWLLLRHREQAHSYRQIHARDQTGMTFTPGLKKSMW